MLFSSGKAQLPGKAKLLVQRLSDDRSRLPEFLL